MNIYICHPWSPMYETLPKKQVEALKRSILSHHLYRDFQMWGLMISPTQTNHHTPPARTNGTKTTSQSCLTRLNPHIFYSCCSTFVRSKGGWFPTKTPVFFFGLLIVVSSYPLEIPLFWGCYKKKNNSPLIARLIFLEASKFVHIFHVFFGGGWVS